MKGSNILISDIGLKEYAKQDVEFLFQTLRKKSTPDGFTLEVKPPALMHTKQTCSRHAHGNSEELSPLDSGGKQLHFSLTPRL